MFFQPQPPSGKVHVTQKIAVGLLRKVLICNKNVEVQKNTNHQNP
jgi:hypothetical protein